MRTVDLVFPVVCHDQLPVDHGYLLYSALARVLPCLHAGDVDYQLFPITPDKRLRIRLPVESVGNLLPLAGKGLSVANHSVVLGCPTVYPLTASPILRSPYVTFRRAWTPEDFLAVCRKKLTGLGVRGEPSIPAVRGGPHKGQPSRRIMTIKGSPIIGYALVVSGLSPEDSLTLQSCGLGGRRKMGGGCRATFFNYRRPLVETLENAGGGVNGRTMREAT